MLKAVLFDVDDTLIDWGLFDGPWEAMETKHLHNVFEFICSDVHPLTDVEAYRTEYHRRTRAAWIEARTTLRSPHLGKLLVETAVALGVPGESLDMQACLNAYQWAAVHKTEVFPDVAEALTLLRTHGLRFGLVTNAFHPMTLRDIELGEHGILDFFPECRITAADIGYLKPHPEIFEAALQCLGVKASEAVFVGDNLVADVAGAQAAGMLGVMRVRQGYTLPRTGLVIPDAMITSLMQLPALFDEWFSGW